ncbi:MAG: methyltransferase domain-containing protein [Anaerolineae bacterium]|nr:methyltransferase domain-containing protein [Anaerolineae bacterium]
MSDQPKLTAGEVMARFRQMPDKQALVRDCYLGEDFLEAAQRFYKSDEFQAILDHARQRNIPRGGRVLDLGGGNGAASMAWQWAGYPAVLVEPDPSDVVGTGVIMPFLGQNDYNVQVCSAYSERLPFPDGSFDVVYVRQVLHHVSSLERSCAEVYRVLKPGGMFFATREHVVSRLEDVAIFQQNHPVHAYTGDENAHLLTSYTGAIQAAGFRQISVLGPWDSVINTYPKTRAELIRTYGSVLRRFVKSGRLAVFLAHWPVLQTACGRYLSRQDDTPGRLYSFVATRQGRMP